MASGVSRAGLLLALLSACNGCVILLGAYGGAAGARYFRGTLHEDLDSPLAEVYQASKQALYDLGLPVDGDTLVEEKPASLGSVYNDGRDISIHIKSQSEQSCRVSIHVGGGDERRSELILENIKRNL